MKIFISVVFLLGVRHWTNACETSFRDNLKKYIQSRFENYHKNWPQISFFNKRFVFYTYNLLHRTSYVVRRRIWFITFLFSSYIYSPPHTYKVKESLISSAQQPLSLSFSIMMTVSLLFFVVDNVVYPSPFLFYIWNENVCECWFSGWKRIEYYVSCMRNIWFILREKKKKRRAM
jgi:hypothetical protein